MKVLVDTSVWSEALRRSTASNRQIALKLSELIEDNRTVIIGPIKQEILSGIKSEKQFIQLFNVLNEFPSEPILDIDYISAASLYNKCREGRIQGGHIDFLICAVSQRLNCPIFTLDTDFERYAGKIDIKVF